MASYSGSAGNDQYFGTPEADRIAGQQGQDQLRGGAGDDFLSGGSGPDALYGDVGDDRIEGGSGDDVVRGGRGADTIRGGEGTDVLFGDRDDDEMSGDEGDDVLFGGPGDDTFHGGDGSDIVHGGSGTDTVDYGNSSAPVVVSLNSYDPQSGGHAEGDLLLAIENVLGSPGDDLITGSAAAVNHLDGRGGDDRLVLQQGGTLVGGPGDDAFVFGHAGLAAAEIRDFTKGEDKIVIEFGFFDDDLNYVEVDESRLKALLGGSEGNVLDFSQLGPEFEGFGSVTLNVPVSTLDTSDFLLG